MIAEHERVVLLTAMPEQGLEPGDIGVLVLVHGGGAAYEVEFMTPDGKTIDVVTLAASQVRAIEERELAHARKLPPA